MSGGVVAIASFAASTHKGGQNLVFMAGMFLIYYPVFCLGLHGEEANLPLSSFVLVEHSDPTVENQHSRIGNTIQFSS